VKYKKTSSPITLSLGVLIFALVLTLATPSLFSQQASRPSDVLGLPLVGHHVSDIERSIKFYEAIDFKLAEGPSAWNVDKELNRLGNTPGAESRTAVMKVQSSVSDVPFTFVLRQYRGIQRQDRLGKQAGFNHYATTIIDPQKAQDFYVKVLGGDYPNLENLGGEQTVLHGWFRQAPTNDNLRVELLSFTANKGKTAPPLKFQDINANYAGFQVSNIETAYARAKANGAITVSEGGIIDYNKGKAALIRDPDAGTYIMLWQPPR